VLGGSLEVRFADGKVFRLEPGDGLYFDSAVGHVYVTTSQDTQVLVCSVDADTNRPVDAIQAFQDASVNAAASVAGTPAPAASCGVLCQSAHRCRALRRSVVKPVPTRTPGSICSDLSSKIP